MSRGRRRLLAGIAVLAIIASGIVWWLRGPGPMDFASGSTVSLADYHSADPTGV
ncbi:MAG: cytochrome c, partial [Alphaproteobacteria bacterium]|nr:cytochrome c [Alphaproteobacteria bacterium]